MPKQDFQPNSNAADGHDNKMQGIMDAASDAFSKASDAARDVGTKAKQAASDTAFTMTEQVKDLLDHQIGNGVAAAGHFVSSIKLAATDLDREAPVLAGFVRNFANRVEDLTGQLEGQTVDHFARSASDFTRRQPALVFGVAALAGFFIFRTLKSAPAVRAPSIQPDEQELGRHNG
jgi:ElaB/YqjD/DUF883 family membrane-anchored ribosome-binding protein